MFADNTKVTFQGKTYVYNNAVDAPEEITGAGILAPEHFVDENGAPTTEAMLAIGMGLGSTEEMRLVGNGEVRTYEPWDRATKLGDASEIAALAVEAAA